MIGYDRCTMLVVWLYKECVCVRVCVCGVVLVLVVILRGVCEVFVRCFEVFVRCL